MGSWMGDEVNGKGRAEGTKTTSQEFQNRTGNLERGTYQQIWT